MGRRSKKQRSSEGRDGGGEAAKGTVPFSLTRKLGQSPLTGPRTQSPYVTLAVCGLLLAAVVVVYGQAARFEFLNYDNGTYVSENATIRQGVSWQGIGWSFTSFDGANWHPVTWLSHTLDCQLFGLRAAGTTRSTSSYTPPTASCCSCCWCG